MKDNANLLHRLKGQDDIALEMISELPEEVFMDPNSSFVDLSMGGGQYLSQVAKRCSMYHNDEDIYPRIYGAEVKTIHLNWAKRNGGLSGANLTKNYSDFSDMNFTVGVGNPPYIKNTHLEFLLSNIDHCGYVALTHPAGWLFRTENSLEREVKQKLKGRLRKLVIYNGNTTFLGAKFQCPLVITYVVPKHEGPIELHYKSSGNTYYIDSLDDMPTGLWEPNEQQLELVSMIKNNQSRRVSDLVSVKSSQFFIKCPEISGDGRSMDKEKLCKDDFFTFFYPGSDLSGEKKTTGRRLVVSSESEVDFLKSYLMTKFARFCLSIEKITTHLYISRYLQNVPLPPLDRDWDDASVYRYFGLSGEQIKYIDDLIPNFYKCDS